MIGSEGDKSRPELLLVFEREIAAGIDSEIGFTTLSLSIEPGFVQDDI